MHFRLRSFSGPGPCRSASGFRVVSGFELGPFPGSGSSQGRSSNRIEVITLPPRFLIYSCSGVPKGNWFACTSSKRMPFS